MLFLSIWIALWTITTFSLLSALADCTGVSQCFSVILKTRTDSFKLTAIPQMSHFYDDEGDPTMKKPQCHLCSKLTWQILRKSDVDGIIDSNSVLISFPFNGKQLLLLSKDWLRKITVADTLLDKMLKFLSHKKLIWIDAVHEKNKTLHWLKDILSFLDFDPEIRISAFAIYIVFASHYFFTLPTTWWTRM